MASYLRFGPGRIILIMQLTDYRVTDKSRLFSILIIDRLKGRDVQKRNEQRMHGPGRHSLRRVVKGRVGGRSPSSFLDTVLLKKIYLIIKYVNIIFL